MILPNVPAGQLTHAPAPSKLYLPMGQGAAVALVEAAGHAYPAEQFPVQDALVRPLVSPYTPPGQAVQALAPLSEYRPAPHRKVVAFVDPAGQAYPAIHDPSQDAVVRPAEDPNRPAEQRLVHAADVNLVEPPYSPAAQTTHASHPDREYRPGPHAAAVALVDPAAHSYPALQLAVHDDIPRPVIEPNRPASHKPLQAEEAMAAVAP